MIQLDKLTIFFLGKYILRYLINYTTNVTEVSRPLLQHYFMTYAKYNAAIKNTKATALTCRQKMDSN